MSKHPDITDKALELPDCSVGYCYPKPENCESGFLLVASEIIDGKLGDMKGKKTFDCWESMLLFSEVVREAALDWQQREALKKYRREQEVQSKAG